MRYPHSIWQLTIAPPFCELVLFLAIIATVIGHNATKLSLQLQFADSPFALFHHRSASLILQLFGLLKLCCSLFLLLFCNGEIIDPSDPWASFHSRKPQRGRGRGPGPGPPRTAHSCDWQRHPSPCSSLALSTSAINSNNFSSFVPSSRGSCRNSGSSIIRRLCLSAIVPSLSLAYHAPRSAFLWFLFWFPLN